MTDLTPEALDALVHSLTLDHAVMCRMAQGNPSEIKSAAIEAAYAITALRDREAAIVAAAFEAAAQWHDKQVADLNQQIARNNEYGARIGGGWICRQANQFCRDLINNHRLSAADIRALTPSDATAALEQVLRAERDKARRSAADHLGNLGQTHSPSIAETVKACGRAILATIEPEDGK